MEYYLGDFKISLQSLKETLLSDWLLYTAVCLLVLKVGITVAGIGFSQNFLFADISHLYLEQAVNEARASTGAQPLRQSAVLDQAAALKAQDMVQHGYFAHTSPTGVTPWHWFTTAGYRFQFAGENLAVGFYDSSEVYNAWLASPSHRENLLNPNYQEVGTAVLSGFGPDNAIIVVQLFGTQKPEAASVAKVQPTQSQPVIPAQPSVTETTQASLGDAQVLPAETELQFKEVKDIAPTAIPQQIIIASFRYDEWVQNTLYGVSLFLIGAMIALIMFSIHRSDFHVEHAVVMRCTAIAAILVVALVINGQAMVALIPHQVAI